MSEKKKTKSKRSMSKAATTKGTKKSSSGSQVRHPSKKKQSTKQSSSAIGPSRKRAVRRGTRGLESSQIRDGVASDRQSGDLEGLSRTAEADSQSVDDLVEEGNVFEAGAVAGVEAADDEDTKEVHTHEVPEDDVPDEYLEKD